MGAALKGVDAKLFIAKRVLLEMKRLFICSDALRFIKSVKWNDGELRFAINPQHL